MSPAKTRCFAAIATAAVIAGCGFTATALAPTAAEAAGFVGFSFGFPIGFPAYYPPPPPYPYYPPPYPPPPSGYQPPGSPPHPGSYTPPPSRQSPRISYTPRPAWTDASGRQCREYKATRDIGGRARAVYGTACRDPDGQWRIVN